ncbi:MAG: hypothetical protein PF495_00850, partial [Spirochaetales bacterium]|nr:hypothetical protein [Spirochaetales bacterium]
MNRVSRYNDINSYTTKDMSQIRELIHPNHNGNNNQSIAEARVVTGGKTNAHYHLTSEEAYITTEGTGKLYIQKQDKGNGTLEVDLQPGVN